MPARAALLLLASMLAIASEPASTALSKAPSGKGLWWVSVAAVGASTAADSCASWGKYELNPVLRGSGGRFDGRSLGIKASAAGSNVLIQWIVLRKHPRAAKPLAIANFAISAVLTAAAVRNAR